MGALAKKVFEVFRKPYPEENSADQPSPDEGWHAGPSPSTSQERQNASSPSPTGTIGDGSCPAYGSQEKGRWLNGRLLRRYSLNHGDRSIVAVKVWSEVLNETIWVVADDLPRDQWPQDAPVYTQGEVKILIQVGSDTLQWVHPVKELFGACVVSGGRRSVQASEPGQQEKSPNDG